MVANPRNILLLASLTAAAVLTWTLARDTREAVSDQASTQAAPRVYYLVNAVMHGIDESGATAYRIHAERIEQTASDQPLSLTGVRVESAEGSGVQWDLRAESGTALADTSMLSLSGVSALRKPDVNEREASFETAALEIDIRNSTVSTESEISFLTSNWSTTATGLQLDLRTNTYEFLSNAKIRVKR